MRTKELKKLVQQLMEDPKYRKMPFEELSESIGLKKKSERQMLTHVLKELEKKKKVKTITDTNTSKTKDFKETKFVKEPKGTKETKETKDSRKIIGVLQGNQRG